MWKLDDEPSPPRRRARSRGPRPGAGGPDDRSARPTTRAHIPDREGETAGADLRAWLETVAGEPIAAGPLAPDPPGPRPGLRAAEGSAWLDRSRDTETSAGRSPNGALKASPDGALRGAVRGGRDAVSRVPAQAQGLVLVGGDPGLRAHVRSALLGSGLHLLEPGSPGAAERSDGPVLWAVGEPHPPANAILVGADGARTWEAASSHAHLPLATLPSGAAWLGTLLSASPERGTVVAVTTLGEARSGWRTGVALAKEAASRGWPVALAHADASDSQRWSIEAEPDRAAQRQEEPGWEEAVRWARDGSVGGLPALLPRQDGVRCVRWRRGDEARHLREDEVTSVARALAATHRLVVVVTGSGLWPRLGHPAQADHVLVCIEDQVRWPRHELAPGVDAAVVTVRQPGNRGAPDGPTTAERLGVAWAGSAVDGRGNAPSRSQLKLARRLWLPWIDERRRWGTA